MQQIADWLEKLGMSEYAERFVENDIDMRREQRPAKVRWCCSLGRPGSANRGLRRHC